MHGAALWIHVARPHATAKVAIALLMTWKVPGEFGQGHLIDAAFELDHYIQRHPIVVPSPGIELGMVGGPKVQIPIVAHQLKQIPDLFLAFVMTARIAADVPVRHLIAQPVPRTGDQAHMVGMQSHLLMQLTKHGLLGGFAPVNATLRKLPAVGANAFAPEHLVLLVEQDDADVRPKAVPVKHNQTPNF